MSDIRMILRLLLVLAYLGTLLAKQPVVHIDAGTVQGVYETTIAGTKFSAFRGIPYARPPIGKYRFKEPHPIKRWPGVWNATEYGSPCLQYDVNHNEHIMESEDCLFLNVFTPKLFVMETSTLSEVLVIIGGKTFMSASPLKYDPVCLMDNNEVIVTFNYRLGILGFLSTEDEVVPGNSGLKDQIMVLQWVQQNIASFGGNPNKVTISGSLAGAASVHYHYFSSLSQGLFRGGVSFGGTALSPWALAQEPRRQANKLAELLGCSTYSSRDLFDCLRYRPARAIVQKTKYFLLQSQNSSFGMAPINAFAPTVERMGNSPFINSYPGDCFLTGALQDLPWVVSDLGGNGIEPIRGSNTTLHFFEQNFLDLAPHLLLFNNTAVKDQHKIISEYIYEFYVANKSTNEEKISGLEEMIEDRLCTVDMERAARLMASVNVAPVYLLHISNQEFKTKLNAFLYKTQTYEDVTNSDDTLSTITTNHSEMQPLKPVLEILTNFVKSGNPTPKNSSVEWLPLVPNYKEVSYLDIMGASQFEMKSSPEIGNRKFWDSLPLQDLSSIAYKVKMFSHAAEL